MSDKPTNKIELPLPVSLFNKSFPYQGGIIDPMWPMTYDDAIGVATESKAEDRDVLEQIIVGSRDGSEYTVRERYAAEYSGRTARQDFLTILRANVLAADRAELQALLILLTQFAVKEIEKGPSDAHVGVLETIPKSYRVTVTVGFGASLFIDQDGQDRYGLAAARPQWLKTMPTFPGDAETFDTDNQASDLILLISSDHPYVNTSIARFFSEYLNPRFSNIHHGANPRPMLRFFDVEQGFGRKDKREFLRFDDGIQNLQMDRNEMKRLVFVEDIDDEPEWCLNGSYMVYRKITENMPLWEGPMKDHQEAMIGRHRETGRPLSRESRGAGGLTPVFASHTDPKDGALNSHIRKVQPRRNTPDLFGLNDLERRFLRRPYPFFDGIDAQGRSKNGLHFVAFMKSIQQQFEHVTNMWQMNTDFPVPDTGKDVLYAAGVLTTVDGGYYFCPPGLRSKNDYFGRGMFE
ncbi:Dyp-type peroxidase [uncultured Roseobacter sp.]|uniref:Dyp-type peroxidase n=1 Tax=uncultured Roseobacter sp. TaxID=114847 RepID=UPI0026366F43|nr:Dyp-type peroxidase [uncultured Roseobacter sp.]